MFKKAIPLVLMSGLVLTACGNNGNNGNVPGNNETPMQNMEDRTKDNLTPRVNDERTGPNLDGLDNNQDRNGTGDGIINGNGAGNGVMNDANQNGNGIINDGNTNTPREDIIIEEDRNR